MSRATFRPVPWLLAALTCLGCFKAPAQQPAPRIYILSAPRKVEAGAETLDATVAVGRLKAAAVLRTSRMLRQTGRQIRYTSNHLWGAPPALLLTDFIASCMEDSGRFRAVWQAGLMESPDFTLSGFIDRFQAVAGDKGWEAVLEATIIVHRQELPPRHQGIIFQKHYLVRMPMADSSAPALAGAMTEAALAFGRRLTTDVAAAVGTASQGGK